MLIQTEAEVTNSINALLDRLGIWHFKIHIAKGYWGRRGVSDIHAIYRGRAVWIEVKRSDWKPPKATDRAKYKHYVEQRGFIEEVRRAKGLAGFATGVNDAISILGVREVIADKKRG